MISAMKNRLLFVPVLLLSFPLALAQAPSGPISFAFDRTTFPVWDFTGAYQFDQQVVGVGAISDLSFAVYLTHDLAGRLRGTGTTMLSLGQDVVAANFVLNGSVSLGGNATRAIFTVSLSGDDLIAGQYRKFSIHLTYNLRVDPNPANPAAWIPLVRGSPVGGSVRVSGLGGAKVIPGANFAVALPPGVDGAWSVDMSILPLSKLGGTATIVIDSSAAPDRSIIETGTRTLSANLLGAYKPSQTFSQVLLTGLFGSRPATLQLSFYNGASAPARVLGKLLGQTVRQ